MELLIQLVIVLLLILFGYGIGSWVERRHLADLDRRESANGPFLVTQLKSFPAFQLGGPVPQLIVAETVIATDYFKTFAASIRRLFGGELRGYQTLLDRARRESAQRVIEHARSLGYNAICNLRLETADIGGNNSSKKGAVMVCIMASATAYRYRAEEPIT
jgi:uncharacterized protein YbjQ (UPF0145 family)